MARAATRDEVARFGHIAARLRGVMELRGMRVADLSQAMGLPRNSTTVYHWAMSYGAPSERYRAKLSKVTGIPEAELMPRQPGEPPPSTALAVAAPEIPARVLQRAADVLSFIVQSDGHARIRLDMVLPLDKAAPLLRTLLDHHLVLTQREEAG